MSILFAVHILDGVLQGPWLVGGFILAALLVWLGSRRLRDEEIPRIAVMSSGFFVASLIPIPLPATHVHLLLNGLVGIILGPRSTLAILLALVLQALLVGHGGLTAIGVNTCIMSLPALAAWLGMQGLKRQHWLDTPLRRWLTGFLVGAGAVFLTAMLNCLVLWLGALEDLRSLAVVVFVAHWPIALAEGFVVAATVNFLAKVKPEMLGLEAGPRVPEPLKNPAR